MMKVEGLEKKEMVIIIEWIVDAEDVVSEGTEEYLEHLRGIGSADITDIKLRDKKESR